MIQKNHRYITEVSWAAMVSLFGYLIAYQFEVGYLEFFGIARQLVTVTLSGVLACSGSIAVGSYFSFLALGWFHQSKKITERRKEIISFGLRIFAEVAFLYIVLFVIDLPQRLSPKGNPQIMLIIFLVSIFIFEIIWPIKKYKHIKKWMDRILQKERDWFEKTDILDRLSEKIGIAPVFIFVMGVSVLWFSSYVGYIYAKQEKEYGIITLNGQEFALVRKYDDTYLFEPLNRQNKAVTAKVLTLKSNDLAQKDLIIEFESIGPLKKE